MKGLKAGAFTGSGAKGNPYMGKINAGIAYDTYEANVARFTDNQIINNYREGARKLIKQIRLIPRQLVLDVGCGTGIASMELIYQCPEIRVVGLDISPGMLEIAKYKFHKSPVERIETPQTVDKALEDYWNSFRDESLKHKDNVTFILSDFENNPLKKESMDCVIANQFMHWLGPSKTFKEICRVLKDDGTAAINTASHYYNDPAYPTTEYGFRYHQFLETVLDEVSKHAEVRGLDALPKPEHNFSSIEAIAKQNGLIIEKASTYLQPMDLQTFIRFHVPVIVKDLMTEKLNEEELKEITQNAIACAINTPSALEDTQHKYDIVPRIVLKKEK